MRLSKNKVHKFFPGLFGEKFVNFVFRKTHSGALYIFERWRGPRMWRGPGKTPPLLSLDGLVRSCLELFSLTRSTISFRHLES